MKNYITTFFSTPKKKILLHISLAGLFVFLLTLLIPGPQNYDACDGIEGKQKSLCNDLYLQKELYEKTEAKRVEQYRKHIAPLEDKKKTYNQEANKIRQALLSMDVQVAPASDTLENFIARAESMQGTPYKLGGKTSEALDCSGLFTLYGYEMGIVSKYYMTNIGNAHNLFTKKTAPIDSINRGDVLYFESLGDQENHIAVVTRPMYHFENEQGIEIIDASYASGVSTRGIVINRADEDWFYTLKENGSTFRYRVHMATNPILSFEREAKLAEKEKIEKQHQEIQYGQKDYFYLSHYNVGDIAQNDDTPCIGASGADICKHLENGGEAIALVAPYRHKYGIDFRDRVVLSGDTTCAGTYTVLDEMNKRFRDSCIVGSNSPHCIRGDIAYQKGEQGVGGNCYIDKVIKMD